jgi:hypothetical protein
VNDERVLITQKGRILCAENHLARIKTIMLVFI